MSYLCWWGLQCEGYMLVGVYKAVLVRDLCWWETKTQYNIALPTKACDSCMQSSCKVGRGKNTQAVKCRARIQIQMFLACDVVMRLIYTGQNNALPTKQVTHVCSLYARLAGEQIQMLCPMPKFNLCRCPNTQLRYLRLCYCPCGSRGYVLSSSYVVMANLNWIFTIKPYSVI